jgi:Trk K+ transport system NAD-binding subunit
LLLPEQLEAIARKTSRKKRILSLLVYSEYEKMLKITDGQRRQIIEECVQANELIKKTIAEIDQKTDDCRRELLSIYDRTLTEEQKKKLGQKLNVEEFIKKMILADMDADTDLKGFVK